MSALFQFPRLGMIIQPLVVISVLSVAAAQAQEEGKRVALIIGNNNYSISPLRNAINDARLMDKALKGAGFKTILREDAGSTAMEEAAAEFAGQLGPDDTALFFYAGHGLQIESENFLVPVDFEAANSVVQAKFKCFRLQQLFEELKKRAKRSIIILDACRNNPAAQSKSLQAGLAQVQVGGSETFVAFSTSPGQVAADNPNGRDSWFTEALEDLVEQAGLTLDDVFTRVKARVKNDTNGGQIPWTQSSLTSTFYFHPPANGIVQNDPAQAEKWMREAQAREQRGEWDRAIGLIQQVLQRKPGGSLEADAKARLPILMARKEAQAKLEQLRFEDSAHASEQALKLDPFSIDAAFEAAGNFLLAEKIPEAVQLLSLIRVRGTSKSVQKADAMLKELTAVYPEAGTVAKSQIPPPPPLKELFTSIKFGEPDWLDGALILAPSPVQLSRWSKAIETAFPAPSQAALSASVDGTGTLLAQIFHVEVNPTRDTRDIQIKQVADGKSAGPTGTLMIMGSPASTQVLANGKLVAEQLPAPLTLAPGKYTIVTVDPGKTAREQVAEVFAFKTTPVVIEGH